MTIVHHRLSQASRWLPLFVWIVVISLFSTNSFSSENTGTILEPLLRAILGMSFSEELFDLVHYLIRKSAHVAEYAILGMLCYRAVNRGLQEWSSKAAVAAGLFSVTFAALDEFHQSFTFNREGRPLDVVIDSAGAIMAIALIWLYNKRITGYKVNEYR